MYRKGCNIFSGPDGSSVAKAHFFSMLRWPRLWRSTCLRRAALPLRGLGQCARIKGLEEVTPAEPPFPRTVGGVIPGLAKSKFRELHRSNNAFSDLSATPSKIDPVVSMLLFTPRRPGCVRRQHSSYPGIRSLAKYPNSRWEIPLSN
jgi:hypothetical protein